VKLDIMRTEILKRGCSYSPSPVEAAGITPSPLLNTMSFEQQHLFKPIKRSTQLTQTCVLSLKCLNCYLAEVFSGRRSI